MMKLGDCDREGKVIIIRNIVYNNLISLLAWIFRHHSNLKALVPSKLVGRLKFTCIMSYYIKQNQ